MLSRWLVAAFFFFVVTHSKFYVSVIAVGLEYALTDGQLTEKNGDGIKGKAETVVRKY